jgi:large subunit ribosomal protein L46
LTPARDIGVYNAYGRMGWNDEVLVGATEQEPEDIIEKLLKDAEVPAVGERTVDGVVEQSKRECVERPMPRITQADIAGDEQSLDRKLSRTLYLCVKAADDGWVFPSDGLIGREKLHQVCSMQPFGITYVAYTFEPRLLNGFWYSLLASI